MWKIEYELVAADVVVRSVAKFVAFAVLGIVVGRLVFEIV